MCDPKYTEYYWILNTIEYWKLSTKYWILGHCPLSSLQICACLIDLHLLQWSASQSELTSLFLCVTKGLSRSEMKVCDQKLMWAAFGGRNICKMATKLSHISQDRIGSSLRIDPLFQKKKGIRNKGQRLATATKLIILILFPNYLWSAFKQRLHKWSFQKSRNLVASFCSLLRRPFLLLE